MKLAVLSAALLLAACKDPKVAAEDGDAAASTGTSPSAAPSATTVASAAAKAAACTVDADCTTHSSYCNDTPCSCQILAKGETAPKCSGPAVSCVVDPCARKAGACQAGACVLVAKSSG